MKFLSSAFCALVIAAAVPAYADEDGGPPDLSEEALSDPDLIARGRELFEDQCTLCHGRSAYPGKAPLLEPYRYEPEFVYGRIKFGFRNMPAWEDEYPDEDIVAMVAWIMSDNFSH